MAPLATPAPFCLQLDVLEVDVVLVVRRLAGQRGELVLLLEERLLRCEDRLQVRLRLALLRPRLELDEVRDRDRRKDADDRNDDHQLDERKPFLDKLLHWESPFGNLVKGRSQRRATCGPINKTTWIRAFANWRSGGPAANRRHG